MKLGLIARADNSGLGCQLWELARHMNPHKVLVIDLSQYANDAENCNKLARLDRFPGAMVHQGLTPGPDVVESFLRDLDVVFTAETFYTQDLVHRATYSNVKTILQYNYEFLAELSNPQLPHPTLFAAPSLWNYFKVPFTNKKVLPVPIATDRFTPRGHPEVAKTFIHIVGRPAVHDRNGTLDLLASLKYVRSQIHLSLICQDAHYLRNTVAIGDVPPNVQLSLMSGDVENYWSNYAYGDVLILPRRFGGLSLTTNEAIGAGMPVIMTDIDPNTTWLPNAWLVRSSWKGSFTVATKIDYYSAQPMALAAKIDQFATDPEFYAGAQEEARGLANTYSWENLLDSYKTLFDALASSDIHAPSF